MGICNSGLIKKKLCIQRDMLLHRLNVSFKVLKVAFLTTEGMMGIYIFKKGEDFLTLSHCILNNIQVFRALKM